MSEPSVPPAPRGLPAGIAALAAGILVVATVLMPAGVDGSEGAPRPFVWRDLALVSLLASLPLATLLLAAVWTRLPARLFPPVGVVLLGILTALLARGEIAAAPIVRYAMSAGISLGLMLFLTPLAAWCRCTPEICATPFAVLVAAVAAGLLPQIYLAARIPNDLTRLDRLVDDMRLGEALPLARRIVDVDPRAELRGEPLPAIISRMSDLLDDLRRDASAELPPNPSEEEILTRAEQFAILGETSAALELLMRQRLSSPADATLRGTIYETQSRWFRAERWYQTALDRVGDDDEPEQRAERARALRGLAYCQRKQGRPVDAERTYLSLLELSPTAETHFLIAQFYEDSQRADLARKHARRAMELSPDQYAGAGERLIDKLQTFQFGCWGVYRAELDSTSGGAAAGRGSTTSP